MRIGIDGIPLATPKAGIGHYTFELAHSLAALAPDDEFELIAPVPLPVEANPAPNLRTVLGRSGGLRKRWWTIGLPLHLQETRLPLFHGTNYLVPLWRRSVTVVTIHDLSLLLHSDTHRTDLVRRAKKRLPTMTRIANHILTDSEAVKREICEHLQVSSDKITVVPLAPRRTFAPVPRNDDVEVRRRLGVEDDFILFVGTLEPRKNLITLVRAFDLLMRTTELRPQLVVAGQKGWLTDDLFAHIDKSSTRDRILFTDYISDLDLAALYSSCKVSVYPSLYEGFGLPSLEAMACGAPVITSRIPAIMETSSGAAKLITPTDVNELTAALVELLTDAQAREHYKSLGLRRAAEYTWKRTAQQTLNVYRHVYSQVRTRGSAMTQPL
jgi:Glycosyltransferase